MEVVYKEMDKNIQFKNPLEDLVFVLAKAAAAPPKVEVNNSCLPKPLVPSAQLTCEGNQRYICNICNLDLQFRSRAEKSHHRDSKKNCNYVYAWVCLFFIQKNEINH